MFRLVHETVSVLVLPGLCGCSQSSAVTCPKPTSRYWQFLTSSELSLCWDRDPGSAPLCPGAAEL